MDSCNVIGGSRSGVEQRIRENLASSMVDIDGDIATTFTVVQTLSQVLLKRRGSKKRQKPFSVVREEIKVVETHRLGQKNIGSIPWMLKVKLNDGNQRDSIVPCRWLIKVNEGVLKDITISLC